MTDDTSDAQTITVNDSAVPAQVGTTFRQVVIAVCAWGASRGYLDGSTQTMILTVAPLLFTIGYGQWRQWKNHREKRALAISAPIGAIK